MQIELFPFGYPITSDTEYFGGIDISICIAQCRSEEGHLMPDHGPRILYNRL